MCQFWTGSFTLGTEPGCSLLMSLEGSSTGEVSEGWGMGQGPQDDPRIQPGLGCGGTGTAWRTPELGTRLWSAGLKGQGSAQVRDGVKIGLNSKRIIPDSGRGLEGDGPSPVSARTGDRALVTRGQRSGAVLAEDDAVLEPVHEVVPDPASRGPLDPGTELPLPLRVVLLGQLGDTGTASGGHGDTARGTRGHGE